MVKFVLTAFKSDICNEISSLKDPKSNSKNFIRHILLSPLIILNMRKLSLFFMLLMAFMTYSQAIQVDVTRYSVPELVNNVLINSPCTNVSEIQWRTGTNFGSENGIGYFENRNPNFPMQNGIILTTGNVLNAPGPNTAELSDGNADWTGDTDLENILLQAGITMNSANATVLEFDFTPISPNFSFDFLFASEEYGNFQCLFSDSFAFLLTNKSTGVTTNLAVVPGTNTPISVLTIRDFLYNSICESVNEQYFGRFNGGASSSTSAINFNGQTVVLKASSILSPNTPYHMKLVIADRTDHQYDSAIFISSSSLNLGQDVLGENLTVANNTAICFNQEHTLRTGLSADEYSFSWRRNGALLENENNPDLVIRSSGNYAVTYRSLILPCNDPITDSILVEYYPQLATPSPSNLYKCNTGETAYDFNLAYNTSLLLAGMPEDTRISYHASQENAQNNLAPLPNTISSPGNETIYVRIQNNIGCFTIKSFQLLLITPPVAGNLPDITSCAVSFNSPNASFRFSQQNNIILNGQPETVFNISYHASEQNALGGIDPLPMSGYLGTDGQTIYARLENKTDINCFDTTSFKIFVKNLPPVDILPNVTRCDEYILEPLTNGNYFTVSGGNGTALFAGDVITESQTIYIYNQSGGNPNCPNESNFKVTIIDPDEITPDDTEECASYTLPRLQYGNFYTQPGGNGTMIPAGTVITDSQTIYVYYQYPESPFCIVDTNFSVRIIPFEYLPDFPTIFDCDSYTLPELDFGNYFDQAGGNGNQIPEGTAITSTKTIYVYAENEKCNDGKSFNVFIGITPPQNAENCSSYTLPNLPIGSYFTGPAGTGTQIAPGTVITESKRIYIYVATADVPNCTDNIFFDVTISEPFQDVPQDLTKCGSYLLPQISVGNYFTAPQGQGTALFAGDKILTSQRIYIYKPPLAGQNCTNEVSFFVTINPYPVIDSRGNIGPICKTYTLTPLAVGNYYSEPNGVGPIPAGTVITQSQTIYIYATTATEPACPVESSFTIEIVGIEVDNPAPVISCDSYILPRLNVGNYYTSPGGPKGGGSIIQPGTVITETQTLYIYGEIVTRGLVCPDENSFGITIAKTPVIASISNAARTFCDNDPQNDGFTGIDIPGLSAAALGNQSPDDYSVAFYTSQANAISQTNAVTSTGSQTIWIRVSSIISDSCYDIEPVAVRVLRVPEPTPQDGYICINSETLVLLKSYRIQSGLSASTHTFQWFNESGPISGATQSSYVATLPGFYTIIATSRSTGCSSNPTTIEVKQSEPARATVTVSDAFDSNQTITITAIGVGGNYIYQLDDGAFQESNVFYNVSSGNHTITIRDINGCEDTLIDAFVLNYPKFFTPNGDGINDTWNIPDLSFQKEAIIDIFDRYGKFIKQIKPSGQGWDGTYNSQPNFATDYWFIVTYVERGVTKTFKAHFSLKR